LQQKIARKNNDINNKNNKKEINFNGLTRYEDSR